ncbi:DUF2955 domain-containing protein [Psychromonas sp. Urea-02u-13]|uniref:DUF2955 domain-containing protein n=1 Tax=Psychromonas sp. Urea-02u-13 TaxID=2058326 RepID=UPI001E467B32|nr:DUF2955 domain-containing protein [Psychromonas sp. Urea-02u-13]
MSTKVVKIGFWQSIKQDVTCMRQMRFAFGVTLSAALAYGINWPLAFLLPIFSCMLLALPFPKPSLQASLKNMLNTLKAFALGLVFSLFFLQYPIAYILMLGLALFHIYYYLNRGGSFWLTLMSLIAILILPMIANTSEGLAIGFSAGFVYSSWLTIAMIWLMHFIFPDPQFSAFPTPPGFQKKYAKVAAQLALKSTLVTFPVAAVFISYGLIDYLLVMVFAALFILKPELSAGIDAGKNSMISTLLGGAYAWVFYWLMVAVPQYHFFLMLLLATSLYFARNIFSSKSTAKYYSSALIAMLVVFNSSMVAGADFNAILINRIVLISGAIAYIVTMLKVLDHFGIANSKG